MTIAPGETHDNAGSIENATTNDKESPTENRRIVAPISGAHRWFVLVVVTFVVSAIIIISLLPTSTNTPDSSSDVEEHIKAILNPSTDAHEQRNPFNKRDIPMPVKRRDLPSSASPSSRIYAAPTVEEAIEEAKKFVVGTWTYTKVNDDIIFGGVSWWYKWIIKADGTMLEYSAKASDDDWGKPASHTWKIVTGKFTDTGERFYAFDIEGARSLIGKYLYLITKEGNLCSGSYFFNPDSMRLTEADARRAGFMERGDEFPFSK